MKEKQKKEIVQKIIELERILSNPETTEEEKTKAEKEAMKYASMLLMLPDGLSVLCEVDDLVQNNLKK